MSQVQTVSTARLFQIIGEQMVQLTLANEEIQKLRQACIDRDSKLITLKKEKEDQDKIKAIDEFSTEDETLP